MLTTALLVVHVIGVIIWFGGLTFVTIVFFPMMYKTEGSFEKALLFQRVEHRFAGIVRWVVVIVGVTGFMLLSAKFGNNFLAVREGLGTLIMLGAWILYILVLLSERKLFEKLFSDPERINMNRALKVINALHWVLLTISYAAVATGVWFGHVETGVSTQ